MPDDRTTVFDFEKELFELRMFRLFEHFADSQLRALLHLARAERVDDGDRIFAEGEAGEDFFILVAGAVDLLRQASSEVRTVGRLRVGQIVGEESFVDALVRPASAIATQPGLLLRCDAAQVRRLMGLLAGFDVALLRAFWFALAAKVRQANTFVTELAAGPGPVPAPGSRESGQDIQLQPSAKLEVFREQGLTTAEMRLLATTLPAQRFSPGATIFFEGELGDSLYIVVEGGVRIARRRAEAGEETLSLLGRGEVFGEMALIEDLPRSADARASDILGCTVLRLSRADVDELLTVEHAASAFLQLLCRLLSRRYRSMVNRLASPRPGLD
ncbi:MAG: cyclic nucleotide-binding domain-containing protein [Acidobacteriota bacterium]